MYKNKFDNIVSEIDCFCEICKKRYKKHMPQGALKGKGMRYARERGNQFFRDQGVMAIPHDGCVRKQVSEMMMDGRVNQVISIAAQGGYTLEEYMELLNL